MRTYMDNVVKKLRKLTKLICFIPPFNPFFTGIAKDMSLLYHSYIINLLHSIDQVRSVFSVYSNLIRPSWAWDGTE